MKSTKNLALRVFVLSKTTQLPIQGVAIVAEAKHGKAIASYGVPLGVLATDENGYASFKISKKSFGKAEDIYAYIRGNENTKTSLKQFIVQTEGEGIHTFYLTEQQAAAITKCNLPAIQNKDLLDYELSPTFFQPNKTIKLGNVGKTKKCGCSENTEDPSTTKQIPSPSATIEERFCNLLMPWQPMKTCI